MLLHKLNRHIWLLAILGSSLENLLFQYLYFYPFYWCDIFIWKIICQKFHIGWSFWGRGILLHNFLFFQYGLKPKQSNNILYQIYKIIYFALQDIWLNYYYCESKINEPFPLYHHDSYLKIGQFISWCGNYDTLIWEKKIFIHF